MIVQRKMADVKLKHHMKVQLLKLSQEFQKYWLFEEIVLFCDLLYMNVTLSSICVSLCLVLSESDHISRLILRDHIFSAAETWWVKADICASQCEAVSCNNPLKAPQGIFAL